MAAVDVTDLVVALRLGAARAAAPNPYRPGHPVRWGSQIDVRPIDPDLRRTAANYLAKYATKSSDPAGQLDHRLHSGDLTGLDLPPHLATMAATAWNLARHPGLENLNLRMWAHALGYRGHWLTKSPGWSTTFTNLRTARHHWQLQAYGHPVDDPDRHGDWDYQGQGHTTPGDAWLARSRMKTENSTNEPHGKKDPNHQPEISLERNNDNGTSPPYTGRNRRSVRYRAHQNIRAHPSGPNAKRAHRRQPAHPGNRNPRLPS
jgi:hypothetical protein